MRFGPPSHKTLIFRKTKLWWENLEKMHLPESRKKLGRDELIELAKANQILEAEIKTLQVIHRTELINLIDFDKLRKAFFKKYKFAYGRPTTVSYSENSEEE